MLAPRNFSDLITFTRASNATRFNASGVLETVGNNVARLDHDPATLAARGLLIEEGRTNGIRNNTMQGVASGSPGTTPTNWSATSSLNGLTRTVVASGTDDGISFVDLRWNGTAVAAGDITVFNDSTTQIVAAQNQTWTYSAFFRLVGGSFANLSRSLFINQHDVAGNYLAGGVFVAGNFPVGGPDGGALRNQRYYQTTTLNNASVARVVGGLYLSYSAGAVIDITLRIGLPQLEQGAFPTSPILTTNAAVTRNADAASVNTLSPWFNAAGGTLYAEATRAAFGSNDRNIATLSDGTASNVIELWASSAAAQGRFAVTSSGSLVANLSAAGFAEGALGKLAGSYAANDFRCYVNGTQMTPDTSGAVPASLTQFAIGGRYGSSFPFNGHIRRVSYYPRASTDAELQALTA